MTEITEITLGADPEMVVTKGVDPISSIGILEGSKYNPITDGHGIQYSKDNVLAEFAIPVTSSIEEFCKMIKLGKKGLTKLLPSGHGVVATASAVFKENELMSEEAMVLGCEPDFDAWTVSVNPKPKPINRIRSCGGHIHIGAGKGTSFLKTHEGRLNTIKAMDLVVGMALCSLGDSRKELSRRSLYGKAGCHRPKSYGVEYRTPSSKWIEKEKTTRLVAQATHDAVKLAKIGWHTAQVDDVEIIETINTCDAMRAGNIINHLINQGTLSEKTVSLLY